MEKVVVNLNASKVLPHQHEEWKESAWNNNAWHSLVVEETGEVEKVEKVEKEHHSNNGKKTIAIENGNIQSTTDNSNTDVSEEFNIAQSILDEMKRNEASIEQDGEEEPMEFNDREIVQEQEKEKDQEQKQEIFRVVRPVSGKDPQKGENIQCSFCVPFVFLLCSFCVPFVFFLCSFCVPSHHFRILPRQKDGSWSTSLLIHDRTKTKTLLQSGTFYQLKHFKIKPDSVPLNYPNHICLSENYAPFLPVVEGRRLKNVHVLMKWTLPGGMSDQEEQEALKQTAKALLGKC
jgi:hypothetical protein